MNDPNGLIQWRDQFHLFYQYNPDGPAWGNIHWGHAVSDDLVHWTDLPIALAPTEGGPDKDGCWSGCAVNQDGVPTLLYTGVFPEVQCLATGADDLVSWQKHPASPVVAAPPPHLDVVGFRDPCVWQNDGSWHMVLGTGLKDVGGAALLYRSPDLVHWDYVNPVLVGDRHSTGEMWECPSFFRLGDKYVLLVSIFPRLGTYYFVGSFDGARLVPEHQGSLDLGAYFFAPQTFLDSQGRRLMLGWIWEGRSDEAQQRAGWAGIQSVPRQLLLRADGTLGIEPVPELGILREDLYRVSNLVIPPDSSYVLNIQGNSLEIIAELDPGEAEECGIKVCCSPDGVEQTRIIYQRGTHRIAVDRSQASLDDHVDRDTQSGPLALAQGETLRLHIFLDRSVIEVFANGRCCLTSRIYPSRADSVGVELFAHGRSARLQALQIWTMRSIWK